MSDVKSNSVKDNDANKDAKITDWKGNVWKYTAKTGKLVLISGTATITTIYVAPLIAIGGTFSGALAIALQWAIAGTTGYGAASMLVNCWHSFTWYFTTFSFNKVKRYQKKIAKLEETARQNHEFNKELMEAVVAMNKLLKDAKVEESADLAFKKAEKAKRGNKKAKKEADSIKKSSTNKDKETINVEFEEVDDNIGPEAAAAAAGA